MNELIVVCGLYILVNCVQHVSSPVLNVTFWKMRPFDIVLHYRRSHDQRRQISALSLILLGAICWDADDHCFVSLEEKELKLLLELTELGSRVGRIVLFTRVYDHQLLLLTDKITISASKFLNGVKGLAISEANAKCFVNCGIVPYLVDFLKSDNPDCQLAAAQIIWMLSMHLHVNVKDQLMAIETLVPAAECALRKMEGDYTINNK